jgi:alpha-N-arabinofuranosidase
LRYHEGVFYLVTTNVEGGGNFVVKATDPAGEWSEPIWLVETSRGMDPSLFFDHDGRVYYTRHGGGERGSVVQSELDLRTGRLLADPKPIWSGTGGIWPEGPHLYRRGEYYYLWIAEGGTGYGHMQTVARARSPWGPFEGCPRNPILSHSQRIGHPIQATGHADLVEAGNGTWWLVFLGIRPWDGKHHHLGRETFLAPVTWDQDEWPVVYHDAAIELEMVAVGLPRPAPFPAVSARDDFSNGQLAAGWNSLRNAHRANWSLTARPGWLRLSGTRLSLDDVGSPAFVGRRQQHWRCQASTLLDFNPRDGRDEAGLVIRGDEDNHYDLIVTGGGDRRRIRLRTRTGGVSEILAERDLPEEPVWLSIHAWEDRYEFLHGTSKNALERLGTARTIPLSSEARNAFTGVYLGMYATTGGAEPAPPADFDWFEYLTSEG